MSEVIVWCHDCEGEGCEKCMYTGKEKYRVHIPGEMTIERADQILKEKGLIKSLWQSPKERIMAAKEAIKREVDIMDEYDRLINPAN